MDMLAHKKTLLVAVSALALTACSNSNGVLFPSFTTEAGAFIDEGYFGNPTMNNTMLHSGDRSFVVNLNNRFSSEVPPTVNFAFDSTVLDATAQASLRQQADWIRQFPEIRFRVYGHTDMVGSPAYNKKLGLRRAQAVVSFLSRHGVSRSRLEAMVSFGETQPLIVSQNRERKNRRTVTEVAGFVENSPVPLNGKYAEVIFREYVDSAARISTTENATLGETAE
jgi:peptidoglycan-associated lipoprotein